METQHFSGDFSSGSDQFNGITINGTINGDAQFGTVQAPTNQHRSRDFPREQQEDGAGLNHTGEHLSWQSEYPSSKLMLNMC